VSVSCLSVVIMTHQVRRTEWNSKIAQSPPTVEYKGIMTEQAVEGEKSVLAVLDKVVSLKRLPWLELS
jgi:hypothetical protein